MKDDGTAETIFHCINTYRDGFNASGDGKNLKRTNLAHTGPKSLEDYARRPQDQSAKAIEYFSGVPDERVEDMKGDYAGEAYVFWTFHYIDAHEAGGPLFNFNGSNFC